jgi:hypothetical protein
MPAGLLEAIGGTAQFTPFSRATTDYLLGVICALRAGRRDDRENGPTHCFEVLIFAVELRSNVERHSSCIVPQARLAGVLPPKDRA